MGWGEFALAMGAFLLSHAAPVRPPLRPRAVARLGETGFAVAYSGLSLAVLAWLIVAAGRAPYVPLWDWAPWRNHVALAAMLPACLLVALAVGRPNPFSFGGAHDERFDPARPGVVDLTRHPLLAALALWAGAHLLANGDLAHALLFGVFAGFALAGMLMVDRRKRRALGADWDRLRRDMNARRGSARPDRGTTLRIAAGLALYAALILLHPLALGVSPAP
jgi:uncharacterized membrane protein